ncbi:LysM peptidoglycan-binding domain-containing protein [Kocuria flava]|uniref:lytic transglycosylase n=1 Tax=Kocuria flava TaxID=446860 RepID=UPI001FF5DF0C|nr:LysM peptidoglycan-binding domain-containing protein [Kocuria flava]MCJ8505800.1 LysM peptidoglycan-binding domain-containing protein [Kocuria flava]
MPFPPDSDTTAPDDAPQHPAPRAPEPAWGRRARAATAVAALAALGGGTAAHAAPPAPVAHVAAAPDPAGAADEDGPVHVVAPGDSLWSVARRHDVEVAELMRWNDLSGAALLHPGQRLRLAAEPAPAPGDAPARPAERAAAPAPAEDYTVRAGDSLWSISQAHGVAVQQLLEDNDLTVGSLLRPGQRLAVGGALAPQQAPEPAAAQPPAAQRPDPERAVGRTFLGRTYDDPVVDSANRHHAELAARPAPSRERVRAMVHETAERMGVDPALALAHAYQESGFDHRSVSPADAVGTMQVIPSAGEWASGMVGRELDLLDPQDNITAGVAIIRQLGRSAPSRDVAIAAYYQGLHGVQKYGMYKDTKQYVRAVEDHARDFAR